MLMAFANIAARDASRWNQIAMVAAVVWMCMQLQMVEYNLKAVVRLSSSPPSNCNLVVVL